MTYCDDWSMWLERKDVVMTIDRFTGEPRHWIPDCPDCGERPRGNAIMAAPFWLRCSCREVSGETPEAARIAWTTAIFGYDSYPDTLKHVARVRDLLRDATRNLGERALVHDASKFAPPEKPAFDRLTPRLKTLTYGSPEYHASTAELGEALQHHYAHNRHHPQYHAHGMADMTLLDLIEMLADWKAAGERHADGSLAESFRINRERFGESPLLDVMERTARELGWL